MARRAVWTAETQEPKPGTHGEAFPSQGFYDYTSPEFHAYLFVPDGPQDNGGYYCELGTDFDWDR
jgi:hypothetical protein